VPVASDGERPLPDAWRLSPGAPRGNKNALKHGHDTARSHHRAAGLAVLVREMKELIEMVEDNE